MRARPPHHRQRALGQEADRARARPLANPHPGRHRRGHPVPRHPPREPRLLRRARGQARQALSRRRQDR